MSALEGCGGGFGAGKLSKLLKNLFGCNSFTKDTEVHTENGLKPISEIKVGDKVLSLDERTEITSYQPVMAIIQGEQRYQLISITLDSGQSLETTKEHPFYIKGKGWNPANSLKVGQALQLHNGTTVVIKEIDTSVRLEKVYNLTVANTHNYFVGEDGVLVHNSKKRNCNVRYTEFQDWSNEEVAQALQTGIDPKTGKPISSEVKNKLITEEKGRGQRNEQKRKR